MSAAALLAAARQSGLSVHLDHGKLTAEGPTAALAQWVPELRAIKADLVDLLSADTEHPAAESPEALGQPGPEPPAADPEPRRLWLVTLPSGETFSTSCTPLATRQEVEARHPGAVVEVEPDPPEHPPAVLRLDDERAVRGWLVSIGETDEDEILAALERCRRSPVALAYFTGRAQEVTRTPDPDEPWYPTWRMTYPDGSVERARQRNARYPRAWFWRVTYADGSIERIEFDSPATLAEVRQRRPVAESYAPDDKPEGEPAAAPLSDQARAMLRDHQSALAPLLDEPAAVPGPAPEVRQVTPSKGRRVSS